MNTGFLSNPAPSNGYDAVLAALAPHSAPAEGSLGGTAPSVHNRVKQTFINPVATYPFIARKWKRGWEQSFHPGDLMFIYTGEKNVSTARHSTLANLPVLNTIMRLAHQDDAFKLFKNPRDWTFIGIMRNSSAASGMHPGQKPQRGGNARSPDRIINIDVRGSTRMFNYWESAQAGKHLMLAWREMTLPGQMPDVMKDKHFKEDLKHATVYQLLPYDNHKTESNALHLKVWGNEQIIQSINYLRPICAGWVFQSLGAGELSSSTVAIRMATQLAQDRFRLPMVNAFLHV